MRKLPCWLVISDALFHSDIFGELLSSEQVRKLGTVLVLAAHNAEADFLRNINTENSQQTAGKTKGPPSTPLPPAKKQRKDKKDKSPQKTPLTMNAVKSLESSSSSQIGSYEEFLRTSELSASVNDQHLNDSTV